MANLYLKNSGIWSIPKKVFAKVAGVWTPASAVWRNNSGTWIKHWPPPIDFFSGTVYNMPEVKVRANEGSSAYGTLVIPSSVLSTSLCHITSITYKMASTINDDDYSDDGAGVGGYNDMKFSGQYTVIPTFSGIHMGAINYSSYYTTTNAQNAGVRMGTINVPSGQLLVGIEFKCYSKKEHSAQSGFTFRILTCSISSNAVTTSGGITTFTHTSTSGSTQGNCAATALTPSGNSFRSVGIGYGFKITEVGGGGAYDDADTGSTSIKLETNSQLTSIT